MCVPPFPSRGTPGEHLLTGCSWSLVEREPGSAHPLILGWQESRMGSGDGNTSAPVAKGFLFPLRSRVSPLLFKALLQPVPPARVYSPTGLANLLTCLPRDSPG